MIAQCPGCGGWLLTSQMLERGEDGARIRVCSASCGARVLGLPRLDASAHVAAKLHRWFSLDAPHRND